MDKRDLKRLRIHSNYVISPDRFLEMFGIECNNVTKLNIHDLHYILGDQLNHVGINKLDPDKIYTGEILLIGTLKNFRAYYRPILYKPRTNNKIVEPKVEQPNMVDISLTELCYLYIQANNSEEIDKYLDEIYSRCNVDPDEELEPTRSKIYNISKIRSRY